MDCIFTLDRGTKFKVFCAENADDALAWQLMLEQARTAAPPSQVYPTAQPYPIAQGAAAYPPVYTPYAGMLAHFSFVLLSGHFPTVTGPSPL